MTRECRARQCASLVSVVSVVSVMASTHVHANAQTELSSKEDVCPVTSTPAEPADPRGPIRESSSAAAVVLLPIPVEDEARFLHLALAERRRAIGSIVFTIATGGLMVAAATQLSFDWCSSGAYGGEEVYADDCGSSHDAEVGLASAGLGTAAISWGLSLASSTAGLRLARGLESYGRGGELGLARTGMVFSSLPMSFGFVGPSIALGHSWRMRRLLEGRAATSLRIGASTEIGRGYALLRIAGGF